MGRTTKCEKKQHAENRDTMKQKQGRERSLGQNESGQRRTRYSDKEETVSWSKTAHGQIDAEWKDIAGKIEMVVPV